MKVRVWSTREGDGWWFWECPKHPGVQMNSSWAFAMQYVRRHLKYPH